MSDKQPDYQDAPSLPPFGTFKGKQISREDCEKLSALEREEVTFDIPGVGVVRPFRFSGSNEPTIKGNKISF